MNPRNVLLATTLLVTAGASAASWADTRHHDRRGPSTTVIVQVGESRWHPTADLRRARRDDRRVHEHRWAHRPRHWRHRGGWGWERRVWVPATVGRLVIRFD